MSLIHPPPNRVKTIEEDAQIVVELKGVRGAVEVARGDEGELAQKSAEQLNNAMATIYMVAERTATTIRH